MKREQKCPRDGAVLFEVAVGDASIDECPVCFGRHFDRGEMFAAIGAYGDPALWDRPECTRSTRESVLACAGCGGGMVAYVIGASAGAGPFRGRDDRIEIDRCMHCAGLWLDHGELERLAQIGEQMAIHIEAEREKARAGLPEIDSIDLGPLGAISAFMGRFR